MNRNMFYLAGLLVALGVLTFGPLAQAAEPSASAGHGLGLQGFGARIGLVDPEGASSTVALGAHLDAGEFVKNVHVMPYIEYWKVGIAGIDTRDFTIATDVNLDFPLQGGHVVPYAGGGLGLHFLHADIPAGFGVDASRTKLGLNIQGGIRNQVMPNLGLFGEVRFSFVESADQLHVMGGFTYNFIY